MSMMNTPKPAHRPRRSPARLVVCALLVCGIIATAVMIFYFSSEGQAESGERSSHIAEGIASTVVPKYDTLTPTEQQTAVKRIHHPVRKLAHMSEYALLAVLTGCLLLVWDDRGRIRCPLQFLLALGFCALYAISDEVHQIFSQRGASAVDVLIDCAGALFGLCLLFGLYVAVRHHRRKGVPRADHASTDPL